MHSIAHYGLGLGIITSALGALVLCVLVIRYGFTPPDDESPEERSRRQLVTRLGHAAGAVCFALTAGLSAVVLGVSTRPPAQTPVAAPPAAPEVRLSDLEALRNADVELGESMQTLGTRVTDVEGTLQRLRTSSTDTMARLDRVERMAAAARAAAPSPARETKRPTVERAEPVAPAPRKPVAVESYEPAVMRPTSTLPRPVSLPAPDSPAADAPTPDITPTPSPQATVAPGAEPAPPDIEPAPAVKSAAVTERPIRLRAPSTELDPVDAVTRGVVRLGDTILGGLMHAGNSIRRFVEDLR